MTEDHGFSERFEATLQYLRLAAIDMHSQHMSTHQSGLVHDPLDSMLGTEDIAMLVPHSPDGDYHDPGEEEELIDTPEAQIASPLTTNQAPCPTALCQWCTCGDEITCQGVPKHFKVVHGIKATNRSKHVTCKWDGCSAVVLRNNFVRHIREFHLDHIRDRGHPS
ncbi:hypothetical protein L210DRAFT_3558419 [Boletus edulis BED1]|uniref:Uncharacterized protein n=1 Tax=Boletus edulis BED1 TaxID=1328754 RepID=A0AAD4BK81_BOLED|nr:hypothetical protein L210DRAFT_3558419 [Boletus edulis BED1]